MELVEVLAGTDDADRTSKTVRWTGTYNEFDGTHTATLSRLDP